MKNKKPTRKLRVIINWILWILLVQFILINISGAIYAYKFTHLYTATAHTWDKPDSKNIFAKTWRLFTGPTFYKQSLSQVPDFAYSSVSLKTKDSITIEGWYSKADTLPKGTVILFHGLMGNKGLILNEATAFRNLGYNIMMVDVRDHGNSGGTSTTIGYYEAEEVNLAYHYVQGKGEKTIFLWGGSMGAVEVIKAVSDYAIQPAGIIIEMPFLSLQSHLKARAKMIGFPAQPFAFITTCWIGIEKGFNGFGFKLTRYARNIHCPVLQQYGEKDEYVLKSETDAIYETIASRNKKLVVYDGAKHESFVRKDPALWTSEVESFLKQYSSATF